MRKYRVARRTGCIILGFSLVVCALSVAALWLYKENTRLEKRIAHEQHCAAGILQDIQAYKVLHLQRSPANDAQSSRELFETLELMAQRSEWIEFSAGEERVGTPRQGMLSMRVLGTREEVVSADAGGADVSAGGSDGAAPFQGMLYLVRHVIDSGALLTNFEVLRDSGDFLVRLSLQSAQEAYEK